MASYADPDLLVWMSVLAPIRAAAAKTTSFEKAADVVVKELYEHYRDTTALARIYLVVPYGQLDDETRQFVDELTANAGQAPLGPKTPVLTLAATRGPKPEWCDRKSSRGHRGIPLISPEFVHGIPMLAGLLKEIGAEMHWVKEQASLNTQRLLANNGIFFVADAAEARDAEGRLLIPAQDFVAEQGVKSVFGMGCVYPDGMLAVVIVFTREVLSRTRIDRLTPLISLLKTETTRHVADGKLFDS